MNPFKIKTLDDFTIADCEAYLNRYPYGEHSIEVKNRMKGLAKGVIKVDKNESKSNKPVTKALTDNVPTDKVKTSPKMKNNHRKVNVAHNSGRTSKISYQSSQNLSCKEERSVVDTILWWVGAIVITLIIGTAIIWAIDAMMPEGSANFIQKYKYVIYPLCLMISKYFEKNKLY